MKPKAPRPTDNALIKRLKVLGCVFCRECYAYAWPDHTEHVNVFLDLHASPLQLVGGYGNVRVVDTRDEREVA